MVFMLLAVSGCGYAPAQMRLVEQARKGVELIGQAAAQRQGMIEQMAALQRGRLDEGFDADVRQRGDLSAAWVIEQRKAYAAGLAALGQQAEAARSAAAVNLANLKAVDAALARLQALLAAQDRWLGNWEMQLGLKGADDGGK
jgi:hypothetical protein